MLRRLAWVSLLPFFAPLPIAIAGALTGLLTIDQAATIFSAWLKYGPFTLPVTIPAFIYATWS